jgi:long-chain fatty acid transport protein
VRRLLVALLLVATPAHASVYDIYGANPRGLSMGQALTAAVTDYTATYYNPAALTVLERMSYGIGFQASFPFLEVERALPFCGGSASACAQQYGPGGSSRFDSVLPRAFSGFTLGALTPFGGLLDNRVAFGITAYLPANNLIRAEGLDPQRPQFYAYQSLPDKFNILGALAYKPVDWLSLGLGFQVLANLDGDVRLELDVLNHTYERADIVVKVKPKANLTAGLLFMPTDELRVGVAWRGELDLFYRLPVTAELGSPLRLAIDVSETVLYQPHQIAFGISYRLADPDLLLSADLVWSLWSMAPDPSPHVSLDVGGSLIDGLGLGETLDVNTAGRTLELGFVDTLSPRFGLEYTPIRWMTLRGGYLYRPTPAPRQTGATNYLDNDAHGASLGLAFTFSDPLDVHPNPVVLEAGNQLTILSRRTVFKASESDPVGDLSHGGLVYSVGISVSHSY